ncbi:hypothetical protein SAMD00023353_1700430 [Rosellinia necatrix]|uniref:Uncharacterized protein n=1 Tax=Rosellinia necatrix TaxID=77044 RepID=A0A1S8A7D2_ROSNE|nr:hypothetical protein SAMD00023353_1700430 [Rosellinia necatrix]
MLAFVFRLRQPKQAPGRACDPGRLLGSLPIPPGPPDVEGCPPGVGRGAAGRMRVYLPDCIVAALTR